MYKQKKHDHIRSHSFGGHLFFKNWVNHDLRRYQLTYGSIIFTEQNNPNADARRNDLNLIYNNNWLNLFHIIGFSQLTLHCSSGQILKTPSMGAILDIAFSTITGLAPTKVYSRKSIAGFKLSKHNLLGVKNTVRNVEKFLFYYKLYFLTAGLKPLVLKPPFETSLILKNKTLQQRRLEIPSSFLADLRNSLNPNIKKRVPSLAIKNVFCFNELDSLDYELFSSIKGFEVNFGS